MPKETTYTATDLEKAIESLVINGHSQFADCFDVFLDLHLYFFCNHANKRQIDLYQHFLQNETFRENMKVAMLALGDTSEGYHDALGDMFMSRVSHGEKGQFFTPDHLCSLINRIAIDECKDGETAYDPACGSGRTLLFRLEQGREHGCEPIIYGNDISMTCSKMTLLNLLINNARGEVTCGNALVNDTENFTFFHIDRIRHLTSGETLSTYWQYTMATLDEINERRNRWWKEIAEYGWMKWYGYTAKNERQEETQQAEPLTAEYKFGEQLSLF